MAPFAASFLVVFAAVVSVCFALPAPGSIASITYDGPNCPPSTVDMDIIGNGMAATLQFSQFYQLLMYSDTDVQMSCNVHLHFLEPFPTNYGIEAMFHVAPTLPESGTAATAVIDVRPTLDNPVRMLDNMQFSAVGELRGVVLDEQVSVCAPSAYTVSFPVTIGLHGVSFDVTMLWVLGVDFTVAESNECGCVSICDDPHFLGLNGVRYNFQGEPDKTFALVSDSAVQLNSRFLSRPFGGKMFTNLGPTCLRTCTENVTMLPNGEVRVNGERLYWNNETALRAHRFANLEITYLNKRIVELHVPGQWRFVVQMLGDYVNVNKVSPIASGNQTVEKSHPDVHGVLGHTLGAPVHPHYTKCNSFQQGGCAVEGDFADYEVDGDLCSTQWKHSRFDEDQC